MKKTLLPLLLLAALAVPMLLPKASAPASVEIKTLTATTVYTSVHCTGTLEPARLLSLSVPAAAQTEEIFVMPGDRVRAGQLLLTYRESQEGETQTEVLLAAVEALADGAELPALPDVTAAENGCLAAPFDGKILRIETSEGVALSPLIGAIWLCDDSRILARLRVSEGEWSGLQPGMPITVTGEAFSGNRSGVVIETALRTSFSLTGATSRYGEVLCELQDCQDLPVGCTLQATISQSRIRNAITVPYSAIRQDEDGAEYVLLWKNGRAEKQIITTAEDLGDEVRVSSGLTAGDRLILGEVEEGREVTGT